MRELTKAVARARIELGSGTMRFTFALALLMLISMNVQAKCKRDERMSNPQCVSYTFETYNAWGTSHNKKVTINNDCDRDVKVHIDIANLGDRSKKISDGGSVTSSISSLQIGWSGASIRNVETCLTATNGGPEHHLEEDQSFVPGAWQEGRQLWQSKNNAENWISQQGVGACDGLLDNGGGCCLGPEDMEAVYAGNGSWRVAYDPPSSCTSDIQHKSDWLGTNK